MTDRQPKHGPTPPTDWEAECALLGAMILDGRMIGDAEAIVSPADFASEANRAIYAALLEMFHDGVPIDMVHLNGRLRDAGRLEKVGGVEYMLTLAESVPSAVTAPYYAKRVADCATVRRIIATCEDNARRAYRDPGEPDDLLDGLEQDVSRIRQQRTSTDGPQSIGEILDVAFAKIASGTDVSYSTGSRLLDDHIGGLRPGEVVIVGARPSMGKTALAVSMLWNLAVECSVSTAMFSMEMSSGEIANRLMSMGSDVWFSRIRSRQLETHHFESLREAADRIAKAPIVVDDTGGLSIMELRARARKYVAKHKAAVIFIDYLQLMSGGHGKHNNRTEEVGAISRGLKSLAKELAVPIVCLAQLNRVNESRSGHRPRMSDLRESGSIEQDADAIILLHRESYYREDADQRSSLHDRAEMIVGKSRNGPTGTVFADFHGPTGRFVESLNQHAEEYQ